MDMKNKRLNQVRIERIVIRKGQYAEGTSRAGQDYEMMLFYLNNANPAIGGQGIRAQPYPIYSDSSIFEMFNVCDKEDEGGDSENKVITAKAIEAAIAAKKLDAKWKNFCTTLPIPKGDDLYDPEKAPIRFMSALVPISDGVEKWLRLNSNGEPVSRHIHGVEIPVIDTHVQIWWQAYYGEDPETGDWKWQYAEDPEEVLKSLRERMYIPFDSPTTTSTTEEEEETVE